MHVLQILLSILLHCTRGFEFKSLRSKNDRRERESTKGKYEMMAALYLQVSTVSQALLFVTRSRSWSFVERPGLLLVSAFVVAQLVRIHRICQSLLKTTESV